jgi:subtilisin
MPALSALLAQPEVFQIEPDLRVSAERVTMAPAGDNQTTPWGVPHIGAPLDGLSEDELSAVHLYVLDTRVNADDVNLVEEIEFTQKTGKDVFTHGYHIAGTAAALDNDTGVVGVAPGVSVHNMVVLNKYGMTSMSVVLDAINMIIERKEADEETPVIMSLSFGAYIGVTWKTALDEALTKASEAGIIVIVSSGNDGLDASKATPAHAEGVITVGSHGPDRKHSHFSNHGDAVDILAPGEDILSLGKISKKKIVLLLGSGTSFAVPHVAGAAAAVLAREPKLGYEAVLARISSKNCVSDAPGNTTTTCVALK